MIISPETSGPCKVDVTYRDLNGAGTTPSIRDNPTLSMLISKPPGEAFSTVRVPLGTTPFTTPNPHQQTYFVSASLIVASRRVYYTSDERELPKLLALADAMNKAFAEYLAPPSDIPPAPPTQGEHWCRATDGALKTVYKYDTGTPPE